MKSSKKIASKASQKLKELGAAVLGIVINTVSELKVNEDGSPYGYGYGYGYGYKYVSIITFMKHTTMMKIQIKNLIKKRIRKQIKDKKTSSAYKLLED